jgi:hypothetical protein
MQGVTPPPPSDGPEPSLNIFGFEFQAIYIYSLIYILPMIFTDEKIPDLLH